MSVRHRRTVYRPPVMPRPRVRAPRTWPANRPAARSRLVWALRPQRPGLGRRGVDCRGTGSSEPTIRKPPAPLADGQSAAKTIFRRDEAGVYASGLRYEDLVAAVDVVVTKPGYGIIAECIANDTAILYTTRGHFPEYDVLVAQMPRFTRCAFIDQNDLRAGRWAEHLDKLLAQAAPPERPATTGADIIADGMVGYL